MSCRHESGRYFSSIAVLGAFMLTGTVATPAFAWCQAGIRFGLAGQYAGFQLGAEKFKISSGGTVVDGNVAKALGDVLDFSGGGQINGTIFRDSGVVVNLTGGASATGGVVNRNLGLAVAQAVDASALAASVIPGLILSGIDNSTGTIPGAADVNIIEVSGDVKLSGGHTLTLQAGPNAFFVFNVMGEVKLSGGSSIALAGGIPASHVLFNVVGTGKTVDFSGGSSVKGTFLAPERDITVSGGTHLGAFIDGGELKFQSGPHITLSSLVNICLCPPGAPCFKPPPGDGGGECDDDDDHGGDHDSCDDDDHGGDHDSCDDDDGGDHDSCDDDDDGGDHDSCDDDDHGGDHDSCDDDDHGGDHDSCDDDQPRGHHGDDD